MVAGVAIFLAVADAFLMEELRLSEKFPADSPPEDLPDEVAAGASSGASMSLSREPPKARWMNLTGSRNRKVGAA